ncbi:DNA-binding response regulator [Sphingobacteriaceae bacterium]|nr:DNA-binding response regulator [Sphingobacteriaceae bacterium]
MSTILLIEDESSVSNFIRKGLSEEGYSVSVAFNGSSGIQMAKESAFDLIVLDIMLPDINGVEVCQELRKQNLKTPVLFLTALGTPENIAHGLNSGGDDYLVKPFKFIELNARIKALLRRSDSKEQNADQQNIFTLADLKVNDYAKKVERNGVPISLTATEYRLLLVLLKNKGRVLSRLDLLENVWDMSFNMGTNVVDVYINYLRKKIDADRDKKLIHTVIGMGYVIKEE